MQPKVQVNAGLVELFNSVLAGRRASDLMSEALCQEWLPAMAALLARERADSAVQVQVRRTLVRLGWLLQHLPQAASIHATVLERAIREYRSDWQQLAARLFSDDKHRARHTRILDAELLDGLHVQNGAHSFRETSPRRPIVPIVGLRAKPTPVHPHDRGLSGTWQAVLSDSRERRRDESEAMDALTRVAGLRAGDRVQMLLPGGVRETWRVLRSESARRNILLENEETRRQGVLGMQTMAMQLDQGRMAILA